MFMDLLTDQSVPVRSAATSALAELAQYVVELRDAICPAIPRFMDLLTDRHMDTRSAAAFALATFAEHGE